MVLTYISIGEKMVLNKLLIFFITSIFSTLIYVYLHIRTKINLKYVFQDNIFIILIAFLITIIFFKSLLLQIMAIPLLVISLIFGLTMIRFWYSPKRKITAKENEIVSPADGNVIYVKKIEKNEIPISIKVKSSLKLNELTKTNLLNTPCWLIGINMTLFDVHKNCAPINGKVILNKHFNGKFYSLKSHNALCENERNTYIIRNEQIQIGVVQIASKRVRRIDSYIKEGQFIKKGEWLGMIRFGSQVDVIIPENCNIKIEVGQQVYAIKTIIADY